MTSTSRILPTLVALVLLLGAGSASADPQSEARAHFRVGRRLFDRGDAPGARAAFEEAYRVLPNPRVLANIAACFAAEGKTVESVRTYRRFLREAGDDVPAAAKTAAQAELERLHGAVGHLVLVVEPAGASISVDGESIGTAPFSDPFAVAPGAHVVDVTAEGLEPLSRTVGVSAGQEVRVSLSPRAPEDATDPLPPPTPEPAPSPVAREAVSTGPGTLVWVGLGVTAALAIGGTITGVSTLQMKSEYEDAATSQARREQLADSTPMLATVTDVLLDTALLAGLATLGYWIFIDGPKERADADARAPRVGIGMDGWRLAWDF